MNGFLLRQSPAAATDHNHHPGFVYLESPLPSEFFPVPWRVEELTIRPKLSDGLIEKTLGTVPLDTARDSQLGFLTVEGVTLGTAIASPKVILSHLRRVVKFFRNSDRGVYW